MSCFPPPLQLTQLAGQMGLYTQWPSPSTVMKPPKKIPLFFIIFLLHGVLQNLDEVVRHVVVFGNVQWSLISIILCGQTSTVGDERFRQFDKLRVEIRMPSAPASPGGVVENHFHLCPCWGQHRSRGASCRGFLAPIAPRRTVVFCLPCRPHSRRHLRRSIHRRCSHGLGWRPNEGQFYLDCR